MIYFLDSAKSHSYAKGSGQMMICDVGIGEVMHPSSHMQAALPETVKHKFDTIFGPRKAPGAVYGLANDEWIVWHPDQCLPKYIVTYT